MYPIIKLKPGKQTNAVYRHPWIFSGALAQVPAEAGHGDLVHAADSGGKVIGTGTYSSRSSIAVRLFEFRQATIDSRWLAEKFKEADALRRLCGYGPDQQTSGYRLVFGEADGIPGLVVDRYADVLVFQISTAGMEKLRQDMVDALVETFKPKAVIERSDLPARREEGLEDVVALRHGQDPGQVDFLENGCLFLADVMSGQKTGFFLDQKDLRRKVAGLAKGRRCLNLFSYSGATSVAAMKGGAVSAHNVDSSQKALELCRQQAELNSLPTGSFTVEETDIFQYLGTKSEPEFDLVVMDPPALIKSRGDVEEGKKAYHFLNRAAMRLVRDGGVFVTSSCSHFLPEEDLAFTLRRASLQAGCHLSVIEVVRQSSDHPQSVYFPEAGYLKSFICQVRRPA
jgi:23S rRNA (cytosine1962-C5)-methyltransferase